MPLEPAAPAVRADAPPHRPDRRTIDSSVQNLKRAADMRCVASKRGLMPVKSSDEERCEAADAWRVVLQHRRNLEYSMEQAG